MNFKYYNTKNLVIFIIVLSILYGLLSNELDKFLPTNTTFKEIWKYINVFSTTSLLFLTLLFIDKIGWKWKLFKWLVDIPNLNGRYEGKLESTFQTKGTNTIKDCAIEIRQTASKVKIFSYYGDPGTNNQTSIGYSFSEEVVKEDDGFFSVYHIFSGEPDALQIDLHKHHGFSIMKFYPDLKLLDGSYFNERTNKGTLKVTFKQKNLLGRLRLNP
jgi:SMODS-associating 2TM, beta-strand rich effector domain